MPSKKHDKKVIRNLDDEDYRIRNRTGSNTDAERRRINREKDFEKNRLDGMAVGGKVGKKATRRGDGPILQRGFTRGGMV